MDEIANNDAERELCPECGLKGVEDCFTRNTFDLPISVVDAAGQSKKQKLTVRFPVKKCSICGQKFMTDKSMATISEAFTEFINKHTPPVNLQADLAEKNKVQARRGWFMMGLIAGVFFTNGIWNLCHHQITVGSFYLGVGLGVYVGGYCQIYSRFKRNKKVIVKNVTDAIEEAAE